MENAVTRLADSMEMLSAKQRATALVQIIAKIIVLLHVFLLLYNLVWIWTNSVNCPLPLS